MKLSLCSLLSLTVVACLSCSQAIDESNHHPADESQGDPAEATGQAQSSLDFGCWFATGAPNFWVAVEYISNHKLEVPVNVTDPNSVGTACSAYLASSAGLASLLIGSPYTSGCACKYVCGSGGGNVDNGQCGVRPSTGPAVEARSGRGHF